MMRRIEVASPAKINWFLHVGARRADGFHELETVFQEIDLRDSITLTEAQSTSLECDYPGVPLDQTNLAWRAWMLLAERARIPAVRISIRKVIPPAGGLAGGSSNAAAVLRGLVTMFDVQISAGDVAAIALSLGSDVPFFLRGGTAYARGRGEELTAIEPPPPHQLLLILPDAAIATPRAFELLAEQRRGDAGAFLGFEPSSALVAGDLSQMAAGTRNDLESVAFSLAPVVGEAIAEAAGSGAMAVRMSGSGSSIWAAFRDDESRERAISMLRPHWRVERTAASQPG